MQRIDVLIRTLQAMPAVRQVSLISSP